MMTQATGRGQRRPKYSWSHTDSAGEKALKVRYTTANSMLREEAAKPDDRNPQRESVGGASKVGSDRRNR